MLLSGVLSLIPLFLALLYREPSLQYLITVVTSWLFGLILIRFPREKLDFGDSMLLVSLGLIILSFFGAIPYFMILNGDPLEVLVDGYFESVSGYTTSGLTTLPANMYSEGSQNYHSLVFKRTFSEWIGGLGIVIIFLSILAKGGISTVYMYRLQEGKKVLAPTVEHTARIIFRVYLFYTVSGAMLLWILVENMDPFHALTGIMSNISTGGFIGSVFKSNGFKISWVGECILMVAMILGAVPFIMHNILLSGRLRKFLGNIEIKTFFLVLSLSVILFIGLLWNSELYLFSVPLKFERDLGGGVIPDDLGNIFRANGEALSRNATIKKVDYGWTIVDEGKVYSIRRESEKLDVYYADNNRVVYNSALGAISALTTTGYSGGGLELTGDMGKIILIVLMVIGAGAGSTGGGMKLIRFSVLVNGVRWLLKKYSLPESAVIPLRVGGRIFRDDEVRTIALFFFVYSVLQVIGCAVLVSYGVTPIDALITSVSAQATGSITTIELGDLNIVAKIMLIIQMIAGRLEIFPILTLIGYFIHGAEREVITVEHEAGKKMKLKKKEMELKRRVEFIRRLGKIE